MASRELGTIHTEAGWQLLDDLFGIDRPSPLDVGVAVVAIEVEAARSERERLRTMFDEEGCQAVYGDLNPETPE